VQKLSQANLMAVYQALEGRTQGTPTPRDVQVSPSKHDRLSPYRPHEFIKGDEQSGGLDPTKLLESTMIEPRPEMRSFGMTQQGLVQSMNDTQCAALYTQLETTEKRKQMASYMTQGQLDELSSSSQLRGSAQIDFSVHLQSLAPKEEPKPRTRVEEGYEELPAPESKVVPDSATVKPNPIYEEIPAKATKLNRAIINAFKEAGASVKDAVMHPINTFRKKRGKDKSEITRP
jgi:hypothetical protein